MVRVHGAATAYADSVDQVNVRDPILERLAAVSSRLELVERLLDEKYQEGLPSDTEEKGEDVNAAL